MFVGKDNQIPFDADEIIALVAPRPFFVVSGIDSHWLGNEGGIASVVAAAEVYEFIGQTEIEKTNIAVRARQSDHVFYPRDFCFALAIMDREFKQGANDTMLHVQDLFPEGVGISAMSYPAADYATLADLNDYPFDINSSYIPWSSADKYTLWTAQETFLTNHDVTIIAHSDAPDVVLILGDGKTEVKPDAHEGEEFTFRLTAEQSVYGRYELRTVGEEKTNHSVFFAAASLADALRHGTTKGDEGEENRVLGFASRLANSETNPPLVYIGNETEPASMIFTPERIVPEDTSLMEYGINFHDALFARIADGWTPEDTFKVKNLRFVSIPDYTFEFSMADIVASAQNGGKEGAAQFTKAVSWPVERYNNGPAEVWPAIPDTVEERAILANGGEIVRPEKPEQVASAFKAEVSSCVADRTDSRTVLTVEFSEPLRKGEYAIGTDAATTFDVAWNEDGTAISLTIDGAIEKANVIIFRLMDLEGNLLGGPIELTFTAE